MNVVDLVESEAIKLQHNIPYVVDIIKNFSFNIIEDVNSGKSNPIFEQTIWKWIRMFDLVYQTAYEVDILRTSIDDSMTTIFYKLCSMDFVYINILYGFSQMGVNYNNYWIMNSIQSRHNHIEAVKFLESFRLGG